MNDIRWFRIIFAVALLLAPGLALGAAWRNLFQRATKLLSSKWNTINSGMVVVLTMGYLYFVDAAAFMSTSWRESFVHWWLYRNVLGVADLYLLLGLGCAALAFWGRGAARLQIIVAALLLSLMLFATLYVMAAD